MVIKLFYSYEEEKSLSFLWFTQCYFPGEFIYISLYAKKYHIYNKMESDFGYIFMYKNSFGKGSDTPWYPESLANKRRHICSPSYDHPAVPADFLWWPTGL